MEIINFNRNLITWVNKDAEGRKKYICTTQNILGNICEPQSAIHPSQKIAQSFFRYCRYCKRYIAKNDNRDHQRCSQAFRDPIRL